MCRVWNGRQRGKVVDPVQTGLVGNGVHSSEQQVDGIRPPRTQSACELTPHEARDGRRAQVGVVAHRIQLDVGLDVLCKLNWTAGNIKSQQKESNVGSAVESAPVSPASPEKASSVCLFRGLVLSSVALRMLAPRMAALEAATMVKSLPVMPSKTSLSRS